MEINNGIEDNIEETTVEVEDTTPAPEMVDTSTEEFFKGDTETGTEDANAESENNTDDDASEDGGTEDSEESNYEGNNQYKAALHEWAKENKVLDSFDFDKIDEETFTEEDMRSAVGRKQALDHLESSDPTLHKIVESGVSIDDYIEQKMHYNNMLANDDATLFKGQMYNFLVNKNQEMGVLKTDDNGRMTQESYNAIMDEIETHTANMTPEQFKEKGDGIRAQINDQINKIPEHLEQRYVANSEQSIQKYETDLKTYNDEISKTIDKSKSIVVGFADQSARDDFKGFFEKETKLTEVEVNGKKSMVVPLFHKLQTDNDYLLKMMRLSHMLESGFFTDGNNKARNDAFKQLGLRAGKISNSGKKSSSTSRNGVKYADSSSKEFYEG